MKIKTELNKYFDTLNCCRYIFDRPEMISRDLAWDFARVGKMLRTLSGCFCETNLIEFAVSPWITGPDSLNFHDPSSKIWFGIPKSGIPAQPIMKSSISHSKFEKFLSWKTWKRMKSSLILIRRVSWVSPTFRTKETT